MLTILKSKQTTKQPAAEEPPQEVNLQIVPEIAEIDPATRIEIMYSPGFRGELSHALIRKIWLIFLVTLPLDYLFLEQSGITLPQTPLSLSVDAVVLILLFVCLLGLEKSNGLLLARRFRDLQGKVSESRSLTFLLVGFFVLFTFAEVLLKFGQIGWLPALVVVLILAVGAKRFLGSIAEKQAEFLAIQRDRFAWTLRSNQQLFFVHLAPLVCARLISLAGLLQTQQGGGGFWAYGLLSAVLLLSLGPNPEDFTTRCRRCALPVSRVLSDFLFCPACDQAAFLPNQERPPLGSANSQTGANTPQGRRPAQGLQVLIDKIRRRAMLKQGEI